MAEGTAAAKVCVCPGRARVNRADWCVDCSDRDTRAETVPRCPCGNPACEGTHVRLDQTYPCEKCGKPGHVALDGTPFPLCWDCLRKDRLLTGLCAEIEALKAESDGLATRMGARLTKNG